MSDYDAAILELAALGGDTPTIRTADGRSLRRVCDGRKYDGGMMFIRCLLKYREDLSLSHLDDEAVMARYVVNDRPVFIPPEDCVCDGRGWLPVDEDTAVVVCLEWLLTQYADVRLYDFTKVSPGNEPVRVYRYSLPATEQIGKGNILAAAVFAAARKVTGGVDHGS